MNVTRRVVTSVPPKRRVFVDEAGLVIKALSRAGAEQRWTVTPIPFPADCEPGTFVVHAAFALEWWVDIVVEYQSTEAHPRVELWRVGPWGPRTTPLRLVDQNDDPIRGVTNVNAPQAWDGVLDGGLRPCRLELVHRGDDKERIYDLQTDALRFLADVRLVDTQPRHHDVFISYKDRDAGTFATHLNAFLTEAKLDVWFAPEETYSEYRKAIGSGIRNSGHFVIVLSEHTFDDPSTGRRKHGERRRAEEDLVQKTEIGMIFRQVEDRNDRARVLCDFNWLGNAEEHALLRDEISQQRWHLHTPGKYGIDPSASEDEWVKAYARRIASHVIDIVRDAGGISR